MHGQSVRLRKAAILGAFTALLGLIVSLFHFGYGLEERYGLSLLFTLRGGHPPPAQVVVVSEDDVSADTLHLSHDPENWSRSYFARLIDKLAGEGARVIAFDHFFREPREPADDARLARSVKAAGNVILTGNLETRIIPLKNASGSVTRRMTVEKLIPPTAELADAAVSVAPFPLPKVPLSVSQYWLFKKTVDVPTLPAVALQVYALQTMDTLTGLLKKVLGSPALAGITSPRDRSAVAAARHLISLDKTAIRDTDAVNELSRDMKSILGGDTLVATLLMKQVDTPANTAAGRRDIAALKPLLNMYRHGDSRYLNFYGPAQTITTVPLVQALRHTHPTAVNGDTIDMKGKIVFIGESNSSAQKPGDTYHTVFSRPDGLDLSGVEIAATALSNLLQDNSIRPPGFAAYVATLVLLGMAMGLLCFLAGPIAAAACTTLLILAYVGVAYGLFASSNLWMPVIIPTAIQAPAAFTVALLWKYLDARKVEAAHEQLKEIDRHKTLFLSQVSHELKTPLSSIKGFVDNMLDGLTGELQDKQREYLDRISSNTERLSRMITNLLDLSRVESNTHSLDKVPLRLQELAEQAARQFHLIAAAKRIALKILCPDPSLRILADHDKFIQVITNLVDNAIKFTPAGGQVTIMIKRIDEARVLLSIKDTGVGISADMMKNHLFEPFYQARQIPGTHVTGLGLGLSIAKTLVELHDGTITVDSEVGHGTEFSIIMPAIKQQAEAPGARPPESDRRESAERIAPYTDNRVVDIHGHVRYK